VDETNVMQRLAIWVLPVLFAITAHEAAHGWVAQRLGDSTAKMLGRVTLNPLKHIDLVGTILVPGLLLLMPGGFIFGWAKPVPVTVQNLRNPKQDMALVALAGPGANLVMALLWAMIMKLGFMFSGSIDWVALPLIYMGGAGVSINLILLVLNLLPLPPLDGGRVLVGVLPDPLAWKVNRIEPYGIFILLGLVISGILGKILLPPINWLQSSIFMLLGL